MPFGYKHRTISEIREDRHVRIQKQDIAKKSILASIFVSSKKLDSDDKNDSKIKQENTSISNALDLEKTGAPAKKKMRQRRPRQFIANLMFGRAKREKRTPFILDRDLLFTEQMFLVGRDSSVQRSSERIEACELEAIEKFPLGKLLSSVGQDENRQLYDEISAIHNMYYSQLITIDNQLTDTTREQKPFHEQRGLARIELIKFLLQKVRLCNNKGIKLNKNNYNEHFLKDTELRLDRIENTIRQLLQEAFTVGARDPEALSKFKASIVELSSDPIESVPIPESAPELYKNRSDRKEKPASFIRRVYANWIGRGLLRPHIKELDKPLYQALYKHGIPDDFDAILPKAQGKTLDSMSPQEAIEALARRREGDRKRSKELYHKRKMQ